MRQNKKENKNKRKNEEWIQKARHASSVKDIAHVIETMQFHRIFGLVDEQEVWDKLLILDEIVSACNRGVVPEKVVTDFLREKPARLEVVLTGRNPSAALLELADYITEMRKLRHPFDLGTAARPGVEY